MSNSYPNFFMVGVVKGGTTSLHHYLSQHPEIYMSPVKETNYFSRGDIDIKAFSKDYAHDVNVDLRKFFAGDMKQTIHIAHITAEQIIIFPLVCIMSRSKGTTMSFRLNRYWSAGMENIGRNLKKWSVPYMNFLKLIRIFRWIPVKN